MPLAPAEIGRIDALMGAIGGDAAIDQIDEALRRLVPGLACRHCDASDVLEEPFRSVGLIDLHLLDTRGHCIRVTDDPAEASAVLLAKRQAI